MVIHSDPTSAIACASHTGAGPGQAKTASTQDTVYHLLRGGRATSIIWFGGRAGAPGNERAGALAGKAAEEKAWSEVTSLAHLKLRISERFPTAKDAWHRDPGHHRMNALARTAAQIRTGRWRSAEYLRGSVKEQTTSVGSASGVRR